MEPIILASSSPRRQEILKKLNIPFLVHPSNFDEILPEDIPVEEASEYFAAKKVEDVVRSFPTDREIPWVLGADTVIIFNKKIYGKPKDRDQAFDFLKKLQGKTHDVITSIALFNGSLHYLATRKSVNKVKMAAMTDEEIEWYLSTAEWHGAAGAYRIQGLGSCFIEKLTGTESSVMGLPIFELYDILREQNYKFVI